MLWLGETGIEENFQIRSVFDGNYLTGVVDELKGK
jgi:hypothetical protein